MNRSRTWPEPAANRWTLTGAMTVGRLAHTATSLPGGRVLTAGGEQVQVRARPDRPHRPPGCRASSPAAAEAFNSIIKVEQPAGPKPHNGILHASGD